MEYFFILNALQNINPGDNLISESSPFGNISLELPVPGVCFLNYKKNYFAAALRYYLKNKPNRALTQAEVARRVGVSQSFIGKLSRNECQGKENIRRNIAAIYGYDGSGLGRTYDDFLALGKQLSGGAETVAEEQSRFRVLSVEHRNLIEAFADKLSAYEINKKLLEIERLDPDEFEKVKEYVDFIHARLAAKKIADQNSE